MLAIIPLLILSAQSRSYMVSADGIYQGQGQIALQALTQYVAERDVIPDYRNFYWVESSLSNDIADHIWTYISTTPAYEWPLTARYTVFPEIYGYLEVPDLLKSWDELLKIESFHWEDQMKDIQKQSKLLFAKTKIYTFLTFFKKSQNLTF